jgi:hypothetical protein
MPRCAVCLACLDSKPEKLLLVSKKDEAARNNRSISTEICWSDLTRMKPTPTFALCAVLFLLLSLPAMAQADKAANAREYQPPDLHYELATKDGRLIFHLGEIIELEEAYSAEVPDKYLLLSQPKKVNGHAAQMTIEPNHGIIDRVLDEGVRSVESIMHANCGGIGGGIGSGCADCDTQRLVSPSPIKIPFNLTRQFQITEPGHYFLQTKAANVVVAPTAEQLNSPITLTSNILEIEVVEDPLWSRETLAAAIEQFEKAEAKYVSHGWDKLSMSQMGTEGIGERINLEGEMQEAAEKMKLLDTEESLAEIVRRYDGANIGWDYYRYILYDGIIQSKHISLAIDLLSEKILQPDFWVSERVVDQLTAMKVQSEFPWAFDRNDSSYRKRFYPEARRILHDYVLAVGKSLAEKDSNAYAPSLNVFNLYARQDFCTGHPLISRSEMQGINQQIRVYEEGSK